MAQVKIYGQRRFLEPHSDSLSETIHAVMVAELGLPPEKRFHRFLPLEPWQQRCPQDRSERYLILEILMFAGRSTPVRKALLHGLMRELCAAHGLSPADVEITLLESPRENWGIRGSTGDELALGYQVEK